MVAVENRIGIIITIVVFTLSYGLFVALHANESYNQQFNNTTYINQSSEWETGSGFWDAINRMFYIVEQFFYPTMYGITDLRIILFVNSIIFLPIMVIGSYLIITFVRGN